MIIQLQFYCNILKSISDGDKFNCDFCFQEAVALLKCLHEIWNSIVSDLSENKSDKNGSELQYVCVLFSTAQTAKPISM